MNVSKDEAFGAVRVLDPGGHVVGVVADVAPLRGNGHALLIVGPRFAVSLKRHFRVRLDAHVEQERANHQPSPPFAGFAMHGHDVGRVLSLEKREDFYNARIDV